MEGANYCLRSRFHGSHLGRDFATREEGSFPRGGNCDYVMRDTGLGLTSSVGAGGASDPVLSCKDCPISEDLRIPVVDSATRQLR